MPTKLVYALWADRGRDRRELGRGLIEDAAPRLRECGARVAAVNVADVDAPLSGSMPLVEAGDALAALLTLDPEDAADTEPLAPVLAAFGERVGGYRVEESVPVEWETPAGGAGERTPGVKLVTLFDKRPELGDDEFLRLWVEEHTPLSIDVHPLWRYVRNRVLESLTPEAPFFRGVVEETFRSLDDVLDPDRFYGSAENQRRVARHVRRFIDLRRMQTCLMSEYRL